MLLRVNHMFTAVRRSSCRPELLQTRDDVQRPTWHAASIFDGAGVLVLTGRLRQSAGCTGELVGAGGGRQLVLGFGPVSVARYGTGSWGGHSSDWWLPHGVVGVYQSSIAVWAASIGRTHLSRRAFRAAGAVNRLEDLAVVVW